MWGDGGRVLAAAECDCVCSLSLELSQKEDGSVDRSVLLELGSGCSSAIVGFER